MSNRTSGERQSQPTLFDVDPNVKLPGTQLDAEHRVDVATVFNGVVEQISPAFAAGEADTVSYVANLTLKKGYELTPGNFVEVDVDFQVVIEREPDYIPEGEMINVARYLREDTDEEEEVDFEEDEEEASGGSVALLEDDEEDDEVMQIPNTMITTLKAIEARSHQITKLPAAYMRTAVQKDMLFGDGSDVFDMVTTTKYVLFFATGVIQRMHTVRYMANGEDVGNAMQLDELMHQDAMPEHTDEPETDMAQREALIALSRQLSPHFRQREYAKAASDIIWQVVRVPVPGFTDTHALNRL